MKKPYLVFYRYVLAIVNIDQATFTIMSGFLSLLVSLLSSQNEVSQGFEILQGLMSHTNIRIPPHKTPQFVLLGKTKGGFSIVILWFQNFDMISGGLGEMFEKANNLFLISMGRQAEFQKVGILGSRIQDIFS